MDNLDLNYIFKTKIIKELFAKYDFIKTLIKERSNNYEQSDENYVDGNISKKCVEILERLKFIYSELINNFNDNAKNLTHYIENFFIIRKIDLENDIKIDYTFEKKNKKFMTPKKEIKSSLKQIKFKKKINSLNDSSARKTQDKTIDGKSSIYSLILNKEINKKKEINLEQNKNNFYDLSDLLKEITINAFKKDDKRNNISEKKKYKNFLGKKRHFDFKQEFNFK